MPSKLRGLISDSELMKDQKYASAMDPARQFDVLKSSNGIFLYFSIGPDEVLYGIRETTASQTDWVKYDISSVLAARRAEHPRNSGKTHLSGCTLGLMPSGESTAAPFIIADVYLMNIPGTGIICSADVSRTRLIISGVVDRYFIDTNSSQMRTYHPLPDNISAGSAVSCLKRRPQGPVGGIYTFGYVGSTQDLIYTPAATKDGPFLKAVHFPIPPGATTIGSILDPSGNSFLFIVWLMVGAIYVWTPDNQSDGAYAEPAATSDFMHGTRIVKNTQTLTATNLGSRTVLWV
ncbi:hypothetical protein BBP40_002232 [Aspergillus hancockii]|nr:hypothetical protein BBP40_002232 [Aspergillus hancockii]